MSTEALTITSQKRSLAISWILGIGTILIYYRLTGFGPLDLAFDLIFGAIVSFCIGIIVTTILYPAAKLKLLRAETVKGVGTLVGATFWVLHCYANFAIAEVARDFYAHSATDGTGRLYIVSDSGGHNDGPLVAESFGGSLDKIVKHRNRALTKRHYYFLGSWKMGDSGPRLIGYNFWLGPLIK